jgi:hypothetical protein
MAEADLPEKKETWGGRRIGAGRPRGSAWPKSAGAPGDDLFGHDVSARLVECGNFLILAGRALIGAGTPAPSQSQPVSAAVPPPAKEHPPSEFCCASNESPNTEKDGM